MVELSSAMVRRASRLFCAFSNFLDVVWSFVLLPHTCFLLSCMHGMVETKTYPENIYAKRAQLAENFFIKKREHFIKQL
jgi:hypothetical protein